MKRFKTTKRAKHLSVVVCFLLACFLFSIDANAQYYPTLVTPAEAQTMLSDELPVLDYAVEQTTPGTPEHARAQRKFNLYAHTYEQLIVGDGLEAALTNAYGEFAVNANGDKASLDEFMEIDQGMDYPDAIFGQLVDFLEK